MAFWDFVKTFDTDYLFLPAGAADTAKEVATQQEKLVQAQYERGLVSADEMNQRMQEISGASTYDALFSVPENSPTRAFVSGVGEGFAKLPENINRVLGGTIGGVFRSIPWNLWVLIFLGVAVYLIFVTNALGRITYKGGK